MARRGAPTCNVVTVSGGTTTVTDNGNTVIDGPTGQRTTSATHQRHRQRALESFNGITGQTVNYTPNTNQTSPINGNGNVTVGNTTFGFIGLAPCYFTGDSDVIVNVPSGTAVNIGQYISTSADEPGIPTPGTSTVEVSGTPAFEPAYLWNDGNVTINATGSGDTITFGANVTSLPAANITGYLNADADGNISLQANLIAANNITLTSDNGSISQTGGVITANNLVTSSLNGTSLPGGNLVGNLTASDSGGTSWHHRI